ncbi:hypothetical protein JL721_5413 [Aureococcus anophagefferens]|nr:hypothetical protein JL721_5413 [Aureococcus anophagefferens]
MAERSALFEGQPLRRRGRSGRAAVAAVAVASTALLYGMGGAPRRGLESLRSSSSYKTDAMPRYSAKIWFDTPIQATDTLSIDVRNYDPRTPWDCIYSSADYGSWGRRRLFEIDGEMVDQYAVYYDFDQDVLAESFADDDYSGIAGMEFGGDGMQVAYSSIQLYVTNDAVRRRKLKASDVRRRLGAVAPDDSSVDYNGNTTVLFFGTIFDKDYAWYDSAGAAVENPYRAGSPSITAYSAATGNLPKRDAPYGGGSTARAASRGGLDPAAHGAESSPWREADTYRMSKYLTSVTVPDGVSGLDTCADTYLYTQSGTLTSETRYGYVSFVVPYVFDASDASDDADWDACTAGTLELCTVDNELEPPHVEVDGEAVGFILPYGNLTIRYRGT